MRKNVLSRTMVLVSLLAATTASIHAEKKAYAAPLNGSKIISFDADKGLSEQSSLSLGSYYAVAGTAVGNQYYLQVEDDMEDSYWGYYDFDTQSFKSVSDISKEMKDLTYDSKTSTIYGCSSKTIYTVDKASGASTTYYTHAENIIFIGIQTDGNGGLYTISAGSSPKFIHISADKTADKENDLVLPEGYSSVGSYGSLCADSKGELYCIISTKTPTSSYSQIPMLGKIDKQTGKVTFIGKASSENNLTALYISEQGQGGEDPKPEEPTTATLLKSEYTYGDAMGDAGASPTKRTDYFYGPDNKLSRSIYYQIGSNGLEPYRYTKFVYTTDKDGNLKVFTTSRQKIAGGGSLSDVDRYWQDYKDSNGESSVYDTNGKLIAYWKNGVDSTLYTYNGDNLTETKSWYITGGSMSGKVKSKVFYSDFADGMKNCPQTVLTGSAYATSVTISENKYDGKGNKTQTIIYKATGAEADEDGIYYTGATKGDPKSKDIWTYDEQGRLTEHIFYNKYDKEKNAWVANYNNKRQTYSYTNDTTTVLNYEGDSKDVEKWNQKTTFNKSVTAEYNSATALTNFNVAKKQGALGVYVLTADVPAIDQGNIHNVYRDAELVGQLKANTELGKLAMEDTVGNGVHDWFVQTVNTTTDTELNISDAIEETVDIALNPVDKINVTENKYADSRYTITVEWEAPVTEGAKILGYNFYTNVSNIDLAKPQNTELLTEPKYSFSWSEEVVNNDNKVKSYWIEAVYDLGKVKSEKQEVTLNLVTQMTVANNIARLKALENGTEVKLTLKDAKITVNEQSRRGSTIIIEDATGAITVDQSVADVLAEQFATDSVALNGTLYGTYVNEFGQVAISANDSTETSNVTVAETTIKATELSISEASTEENDLRLVKFTNAQLTYDEEKYAYYVIQGEDSILLLDQFNKLPKDSEGKIILYNKLKFINGIIINQGDDSFALYPVGNPVLEEEEAQGVSTITNKVTTQGNAYTVGGTLVRKANDRVKKLSKGLYIIDGKKVIVK